MKTNLSQFEKLELKRGNREILAHAHYLNGFADALQSTRLAEAAALLRDMARDTCGAGYVGCSGGPDCGADHK